MSLKSIQCDFVEEIDRLEFAVKKAKSYLRRIVFSEVLEGYSILARFISPVESLPE